MRKLFALGMILGLAAACDTNGDDDFDDFDTDVELEQPAPGTMPADTMTMDTMPMDTMMEMDTMEMDTMDMDGN